MSAYSGVNCIIRVMKFSAKKIKFNSDNLKLTGKLLVPNEHKNSAGIFLLHGAGRQSNLGRFTLMQEYLAERGISSFSIDFRGCGESEGEFEDGSINNRLTDAVNGLEVYRSTGVFDVNNLTILGASMGGYVAIKLLEKNYWAKSIILQCAAAYGLEAEDKPLNQAFTASIKKKNNWMSSPAFDILMNFPGQVHTFYGENDEIIPEDVQQRYNRIAAMKGQAIKLPHGTHALLDPQNNDEKAAMHQMFKFTYELINQ
jgi:alpha-beta hydrolase superfamily lysophospholipase